MTTNKHSAPPKIQGHWLFSSVIPIARDFIGWLEKNSQELGPIYHADLKKNQVLIITDPESIKYVLQDNNRNYRKSFGYEVLKLFLGEGLLTSEGDLWLRQRRLAQPAFHRKRLANLARFMTEESRNLVADWERRGGGGLEVSMREEMMEVTMKIVARSLFSTEIGGSIDTVSDGMERLNRFAIQRIKSPFPLPMWFPTLRNLVFRQTAEEINDVIFGIIESRRKDKSENLPDDLLTMLLEAVDLDTGEGMDDQQLRDECMTIFVAGHETTAMTMTWLWYLLAQNEAVFAKLRLELDEVLDGRSPELEDIGRLSYTRAIIDETMRLYPAGWIIGRRSYEDDVIGGYHIPAGTNVLLGTYLVHRRADLWERPLDFWPERWETQQVKDMHRMTYFPFGGGPRLCIGNNFAIMEMVILLASVAQKFQPALADNQEVEMDPLITLRPKGAVMMKLR